MNKILYKFIPIPTHLFMCLDNNCRSVLFALIQLSSYYATDSGWFFRSNADLEAETNLSRKTLNGALDALYIEGIIDIISQEAGRGVLQKSRKYRVNFDKFLEYEKINLDDCMKNPDYKIETRDYKHGAPSFQRTSPPSSVQTSPPTSVQSTNNIENIEKEENKDNILTYNNIYNIEEPNGNSIPNGDDSLSSFVEGLCDNPTDNTAIDDSCSFSDSNPTCSSEPDGNRTTSLSLPTCSLSSSNSVSPTSYSPKGESSNPEKREQIIPREKEISSQQPSDSNASEGTVSVSVPSQFRDGDSCATQESIPSGLQELKDALDILEDYDINHKQFDAFSGQALGDAISLAMKVWGYGYEGAKDFIQKYRKETIRLAKEAQNDNRARIDAEVAKAAAILNDDPKPKPDYGEYSKMFIDDDALMSDDDFDHAW